MLGIDISNHQRNLDLTKINHDFAIIKLTEGRNYEDPSAKKFIETEISLGNLIGVYHFARPDLRLTKDKNKDIIYGMKMEASDFVAAMEKYDLVGRALPFLDWEKEPFDNTDAIMAFLDTFKELTDVKCCIYGSLSKLKKWYGTSVMARPIWGAYYRTIDSNKQYGVYPVTSKVKDNNNWTIWQYSSTAITNQGILVDSNYTNITRKEWTNLCAVNFGKEENDSSNNCEVYPFIQEAIYSGIISEEDRIFFGDDNKLEIVLKISRH